MAQHPGVSVPARMPTGNTRTSCVKAASRAAREQVLPLVGGVVAEGDRRKSSRSSVACGADGAAGAAVSVRRLAAGIGSGTVWPSRIHCSDTNEVRVRLTLRTSTSCPPRPGEPGVEVVGVVGADAWVEWRVDERVGRRERVVHEHVRVVVAEAQDLVIAGVGQGVSRRAGSSDSCRGSTGSASRRTEQDGSCSTPPKSRLEEVTISWTSAHRHPARLRRTGCPGAAAGGWGPAPGTHRCSSTRAGPAPAGSAAVVTVTGSLASPLPLAKL